MPDGVGAVGVDVSCACSMPPVAAQCVAIPAWRGACTHWVCTVHDDARTRCDVAHVCAELMLMDVDGMRWVR